MLGSAHMLGLRRPKRFVRTVVRTVLTVVTGIVAVVVVEWHREGTANQAHFDAICLFIHVLTIVDKERDEEFDRLDKCRDDLKKEIKLGASRMPRLVGVSERLLPNDQKPFFGLISTTKMNAVYKLLRLTIEVGYVVYPRSGT